LPWEKVARKFTLLWEKQPEASNSLKVENSPNLVTLILIKLQSPKVHPKEGVDVMTTIFCDFGQFSVKKLAFFLKPML
jgi:hypothetical protein